MNLRESDRRTRRGLDALRAAFELNTAELSLGRPGTGLLAVAIVTHSATRLLARAGRLQLLRREALT